MSKHLRRPSGEYEVCVHVMSRVVQKRFLIDDQGMEEMRRILRTQAAFAGFDVVTFCFLKNHFHVLLHLDPSKACKRVSDAEFVRRFRLLYGSKRSASLGVDGETLEALLKSDDERAASVREKLRARMGDVSVFMRELKTRFTFWYNRHHQTVGTFWADRFRSVLFEAGSADLRVVAAYIDLNGVRAGLTENPRKYRFCGLGEAEREGRRAREAYVWLVKKANRRRPLSRSIEEIFAEYAAFVDRHLARIRSDLVERVHAERSSPSRSS
ncbi:MAG: transposase [Opitutales bacterium]|nr:transposase [Opitutales bacterium]